VEELRPTEEAAARHRLAALQIAHLKGRNEKRGGGMRREGKAEE
jgi:hypothetical protein